MSLPVGRMRRFPSTDETPAFGAEALLNTDLTHPAIVEPSDLFERADGVLIGTLSARPPTPDVVMGRLIAGPF